MLRQITLFRSSILFALLIGALFIINPSSPVFGRPPLIPTTNPIPVGTYHLGFAASNSNVLDKPLKNALSVALNSWPYSAPQNDEFIVSEIIWNNSWSVVKITYNRPIFMSTDESIETSDRFSPYVDHFYVLAVQTEGGWQASADFDPLINDLLAQVAKSELSTVQRQVYFPFYAGKNIQTVSAQYYLPFEESIGAVRVGRTGLLYRDNYEAAGMPTTNKSDCTGHTGSYCYGYGGEYHDYNDGFDFDRGAIDFQIGTNRAVAARAGIVTGITDQLGGNSARCMISVSHGDGTVAVYIHLDNIQVSVGQSISAGTYLGNGANVCGASGAHLHLAVWQNSREIEIPFVNAPAQTSNGHTCPSGLICPSRTNYVEFQYTGGNSVPPAPSNTDLVRNGNFSSDFDYWSKTANTAWAIYGGVLAWKAEPTGTYGSIEQTLNYSFSTNSVVEMTFTLGNSSSVQKHVRPHLHQVGSWDDMLVCDFYLEPNAPMRTFIMRRRLTQNWANASVYLEVYPPDGIPDVLTDDVSVQYRPSLSVSGSECLSVPNHPVILFRNANQLGDWCSLDQTGWKNTSTCTGFDDKASSIQIRSGWSARVWSDANRTGESRCLSGGTANFTGLQYTENGSSNLNDSISSFEAYHQSTCPSLGTPPAITTHPQNTTINSGETATLTVVAAGTAPLSYQWYRGSSGDTSNPVGTNVASFTTPALTATTSYWVRVSNSVGQANSSTATVTIDDTPTPTATIDPQVPADTNLVKNGSFSAGITQWAFYGPIDYWALRRDTSVQAQGQLSPWRLLPELWSSRRRWASV